MTGSDGGCHCAAKSDRLQSAFTGHVSRRGAPSRLAGAASVRKVAALGKQLNLGFAGYADMPSDLFIQGVIRLSLASTCSMVAKACSVCWMAAAASMAIR